MKKSIYPWQLTGFLVASLGGTLLHYLYDLLGNSVWIAPFSGVNESTWEHMKLLFWPAFIFAIFERLFFRERSDFWCIKLRGTILGLALIPILFYLYNGIIGKSADWLNIAIFFISAALMYLYEAKLFISGTVRCKNSNLAFLILYAIGILFVTLTFVPLRINIFKDPITDSFGI